MIIQVLYAVGAIVCVAAVGKYWIDNIDCFKDVYKDIKNEFKK